MNSNNDNNLSIKRKSCKLIMTKHATTINKIKDIMNNSKITSTSKNKTINDQQFKMAA